jgi:histidinol-phosphate aminotransferase
MQPLQSPAIPEYIRNLVPYVPGKPIEETQRELNLKRVIKLASNENPSGPSPKAVQAIQKALKDLHRYPDSSGYKLKHAIASQLKIEAESIILGNGSNDVIDLLIRCYCVPGNAIVTSQAAFVAYRICAQVQGVKSLEAPLTKDLRFDLPEMLKLVRKNSEVKMVFIANPNNPTGTYVTEKELRDFLNGMSKIRDGSIPVVIDSAYMEFVTAKDLIDPLKLREEFPSVVVLRTFSKLYGLGGLRVGYGVARPEMTAILDKVRQPFNLNALALAGAEAALGDRAFVAKTLKVNREGMKYWEHELERMKIPFWKSQGNFVLVDVARGLGRLGGEVYMDCLKLGVIFRPVANYGLHHALRISIGTMEENRIAVKALQKVKR